MSLPNSKRQKLESWVVEDGALFWPCGSASDKFAVFDLDSTLVQPISGSKYATNAKDWTWLELKDNPFSRSLSSASNQRSTVVPDRLKLLHNDGFRIVVVTNQAGVSSGNTSEDEVKQRCEDVAKQSGVPISFCVSTDKNRFRKPSPMLLSTFIERWNLTDRGTIAPINLEQSFYVGDAAGRAATKDHSDCDLHFALSCAMWLTHPVPAGSLVSSASVLSSSSSSAAHVILAKPQLPLDACISSLFELPSTATPVLHSILQRMCPSWQSASVSASTSAPAHLFRFFTPEVFFGSKSTVPQQAPSIFTQLKSREGKRASVLHAIHGVLESMLSPSSSSAFKAPKAKKPTGAPVQPKLFDESMLRSLHQYMLKLEGSNAPALPVDAQRVVDWIRAQLKLERGASLPPVCLILSGCPGTGKSTLARALEQHHGFVRVCQDLLKTRPKCEAAVQDALKSNKSVVIDRTHPKTTDRDSFIDIARRHSWSSITPHCSQFVFGRGKSVWCIAANFSGHRTAS